MTSAPDVATEAVVLERQGRVATLRLNRPKTRNALSAEVKAQMSQFVQTLMPDPDVGCLLITGTGAAFCAGGDIRDMNRRDPVAVRRRMQDVHAWARLLLEGEKPVVMAVNGVAAGAGFSLALLGDVIVASENASFRAGFPLIGAAPDWAIAYTLPRAVGLQRAKDILLTNRVLSAHEAEAIGLVGRAVPDDALMSEAFALAQRLANGPASLGLGKGLWNRAFDVSIGNFLDQEALVQATAFGTADFAEGVQAFLEKRKPNFPHS